MLKPIILLASNIEKHFLSKTQKGFSLLEMAVVLVIVGLLLGGSLIPLSVQMEKKDRDGTKKQLADMREALIGFALTNGRLPCPDIDNDGVMDGVTSCTNVQGDFPWVDMGLGKEDAWGRPFTYRVTDNFADNTDGTSCSTPTAGVSFSLCSLGDITILDGSGGNLVATNLPAVVLSRGKNWALTPSLDEVENNDGDGNFVDRIHSKNASPVFDDLIIWVAPNILKSKLVSAGLLP